MGERSDAELLADAGRLSEAFAVFYRRRLESVVAYFMARTRDPMLAAPMAAETFAVALAASPRYRAERSPVTTWLHVLARTTLAESLRCTRVEERGRRSLGIACVPPGDGDVEWIRRVWAVHEGAPLELLQDLPEEIRQALSAPLVGRAKGIATVERRIAPRPRAGDFFLEVELGLMDAAAVGRHLPWHRRLLYRAPPPSREGPACSTAPSS